MIFFTKTMLAMIFKFAARRRGSRFLVSLFFFLLCSHALLAQQTIRGRVTDSASNAGLSRINVVVRGTNRGVYTDAAGNFSIAASRGDVLQFSGVGYNTQDVTVGDQPSFNVLLSARNSQLNEVVVIGYGTRQRKDVTGAIATVSSKDIEKSTAFTPELALQGQVSGVSVTSGGGNPTARPTIRIRGTTSFNNADPLYVIDGIPLVEGGAGAVVDPVNDPTRRGPVNLYSFINPNDIESISVLKDASAAAIYGVRAANGVILVTTKQGRRGRVRVDFDADYGTQKVPKTYDVLNTQQYVKFYTDLYNANPEIKDNVTLPIEKASFFGPLWSPTNPNYIGNRSTYDWQDAAINHSAKLQNYNLRASGASENTNYNFSVGYSDNDGPFVGYNAERYSISTNVTSRISKYFEVNINLRGVQTRTLNPDASVNLDVYRAAPWQAIYDPAGPYGYAPLWGLNKPITPSTFDASTLYAKQYVAYRNVLGVLATSKTRSQNQTGLGSGYVQFQPITGLRIRGTVSGQSTTISNNSWNSFDSWWFGENPANPFDPIPKTRQIPGTKPDVLNIDNNITTSWTKALNVDFARKFGAHNVDVTLDASQQDYRWTGNGARGFVITNDPALRQFSTGNSISGYNELRAAYALIGYLGRVSYNYNNKYYFDGVVRRDGSSRFAPGRKWGTFPSASLAWRITEEGFFKGIRFLNDLKLRVGYGLLGNENTTAGWKYLSAAGVVAPVYNLGSTSGPVPGIAFSTFPNEPLTWEKVYNGNVGVDALLFNNALSLTVDYYSRKTKGIIQSVALPPTTGFGGAADLNIAEVLNRGFEISASYNKRFGAVGLNITGNFTTQHNEVTKLLNDQALRTAGLEVGRPIGFLYGYKVGGIFQDQAEIDKFTATTEDITLDQPYKPGDIYFQNLYGPFAPGSTAINYTKDSVISDNDRTYIGKTNPGYYYGFTLGADFKGFDFSAFFQGRGDVQRYNYVRSTAEAMNGFGRNVTTSVLNAWTPQNHSTTMPRAVYGDPAHNARFSDRFVENAGFLRMQNLQIGYTIPGSLLAKTGGAIQGLRIYVTGINLFTITDYSGIDPENDLYPTTRQYIVGVKASF